jgi:hypothetical protein
MLVAVVTTFVAATPPTSTLAPDRFAPSIAMTVPPATGPLEGVTEATIGSGRSITTKE